MKEELSLEEVKELIEDFRRFSKAIGKELEASVRNKGIGISPEQTRLLFFISLEENRTQQELAKQLRITPATLSVRLQRLEKAGYISRTIDEEDKRNYILEVLPEGMELISKSFKVMDDTICQLFDGFATEEIKYIRGCLVRIKKNIVHMKEEL